MSRSKIYVCLQGLVLGIGAYTILALAVAEVLRMNLSFTAWETENPPVATGMWREIGLAVLAIAIVVALELLRKKEPKERVVVNLGLALTTAVLGIAIAVGVLTVVGNSMLRGEIARLEAEGLASPIPANPAAVPEDQNGATMWLQAHDKAKASLGEKYYESAAFKSLNAALEQFAGDGTVGADFDAALALLGQNRETLDTAVRAGNASQVAWQVEWSRPYVTMPLPEFIHGQTVAKLFAIEAISKSRSGDTAGAAESLRAGLAFADVVGAHPVLIAQMVRVAMETNTLRVAARIFDTPAELAILETAWAKHLDPWPNLERAKASYRLDVFAVPRDIADGVDLELVFGASVPISKPLFQPIMYFAMRGMLQADYPRFVAARPGKPGEAIAKNAPKYVRKAAQPTARFLVLRAAIDHAKTPIADPAKGAGIDPFTGAPLKVVVTPEGTTIYSVGFDGVDDGGKPWDKGTDKGDLQWFVSSAQQAVAKTR